MNVSKPLIGITCSYKDGDPPAIGVGASYVESIEKAGGIPMPLCPLDDPTDVSALVSRIDGVLLTGGGDIDPAVYGASMHPQTRLIPKKRETFDLALARQALKTDVPLLGICLGCQEVAAAAGGKLIQHVPAGWPRLVHSGNPYPKHAVFVEPGSKLRSVLGCDALVTNSSHHQAIAEPGRGFRVVARAADGIIEAAESTENGFAFAIQWHPERLISEPVHLRIFEALVAAAKQRSG